MKEGLFPAPCGREPAQVTWECDSPDSTAARTRCAPSLAVCCSPWLPRSSAVVAPRKSGCTCCVSDSRDLAAMLVAGGVAQRDVLVLGLPSPGPCPPAPPPDPSPPDLRALVGECLQLYPASKDPDIGSMFMAHKVKGDITDCDGSDSFKYIVFKDANCFIKGSLADLFMIYL